MLGRVRAGFEVDLLRNSFCAFDIPTVLVRMSDATGEHTIAKRCRRGIVEVAKAMSCDPVAALIEYKSAISDIVAEEGARDTAMRRSSRKIDNREVWASFLGHKDRRALEHLIRFYLGIIDG